jgi:ureidoglycolate hydrolase
VTRSITLEPITDAGFAPYGRVLGPSSASDQAAAIADWTTRAPGLLGGTVEVNSFTAVARAREVDGIEVHHGSAQLTITFHAPWAITVLPEGMGPSEVAAAEAAGGIDARDALPWRAFEVPARTAVLLRAEIWHSSVKALADTPLTVAFLEGTSANRSEWVPFETPITLTTTRP